MPTTRFEFVAGRLCLDFVNTLYNRNRNAPDDHLHDYASLVEWSQLAGTLARGASHRLLVRADSATGRAALQRARRLREAVAHLVLGDNTADHLAALNRELVAAGATTMRIRSTTSGLRWTWDPRVLAGVLAPVALSAAELLSTPHALARVHVCESDDGCGWLFPDETRAGTRRWCDMRTCGNRAKAKRHYARVRNRSPRR